MVGPHDYGMMINLGWQTRPAVFLRNAEAKMNSVRMQDWDDIRQFLAVARNRSTLAAAKALGVSQSTVHRNLQMLEKQLGCELVKRQPSGYRLTKLGEEMLRYAEGVEEAVAAFDRRLAADGKELAGVVRVTCPEAIGYRLMRSALVEKFHTQYPALHLEFSMSDKLVDLAKGDADVAIRAAVSPDPSLIGRKIADSFWAVYASRAYIDRHGRPEREEDINRHTVVRFNGEMSDHNSARWLSSVAPDARVAAFAASLPTKLLAVKSGIGLAPLPMIIGENEDGLVRLFGPIPDLTAQFYLMMHEDLKKTPRIRAFFDFVIGEVKAVRVLLDGRPKPP
jgi:DNA-binding transcriptional LysR family regulator